MAASYSILMVHGEAEIGNSHDALACAFGHDSIVQRENSESSGFATIETSGPEAELFALAEKVEFDTEIRRVASTRATTVIGLKLKASYAFTDDMLADSIVGDLLQL